MYIIMDVKSTRNGSRNAKARLESVAKSAMVWSRKRDDGTLDVMIGSLTISGRLRLGPQVHGRALRRQIQQGKTELATHRATHML